VFNATSLGATTSGTFAVYFDGSDVGLGNNSSADVDGAGILPNGALALSTLGSVTSGGVSWANEDVVRFTGAFGSTTSGSYAMLFDLSTLGIATAADVSALEIVAGGGGLTDDSQRVPYAISAEDALAMAAKYAAAEANSLADFDGDGRITSGDLDTFLQRFTAGDADVNSDGVTDQIDMDLFWAALSAAQP
ncbi:MAG: hypothetical protein JNG88_11985, partial [Phycisphaerales bacterium]|nr:hypothetical protein [Phycisphaerales bacterium]